jgi:hypothetical protein
MHMIIAVAAAMACLLGAIQARSHSQEKPRRLSAQQA